MLYVAIKARFCAVVRAPRIPVIYACARKRWYLIAGEIGNKVDIRTRNRNVVVIYGAIER